MIEQLLGLAFLYLPQSLLTAQPPALVVHDWEFLAQAASSLTIFVLDRLIR
jgi:hypothetical protein